MRIVAGIRVEEVSSVQELETVLVQGVVNDSNSFWLSHDDQDFPALALLVNNDVATLNYFPREFEAGFRSVGMMSGKEEDEYSTFSVSKNRADDISVPSDAVLPFSTALDAAKEFFLSKDLPRSIQWLEV